MVSVSKETEQQVESRLLGVMARSTLTVLPRSYAWDEFGLEAFPDAVDPYALALVRDEDGWSQLVPSDDPGHELYLVFRFKFPDGDDNSGFVGWLATTLKVSLGTGVFVTCGHNASSGGIYDYWGAPARLGQEVTRVLGNLRGRVVSDTH